MIEKKLINQKNRMLFTLALPIFLELLLQMLLGNIDQMMIARYSQTAVAAVGNANQVINVLIIFFGVLTTASVIIISQYKGANREDELDKIYTLALLMNIVISIAISSILLLKSQSILVFLSVPLDVIPEAKVYMMITGSFIFLQALMMTFSAFLKSNYLTRETMKVSIIANILNVLGNYLLINGVGAIPALGVTGIAISTTLSRSIGVLLMIHAYKKYIGTRISLKVLQPFPRTLFKTTMTIGFASAGFSFSYNFSQMAILSMINVFGTYTINTKIYVSMIVTLTYMFTLAISNATQIIIGNQIGAGNNEQAQKSTWYAIRWSMVTCLVLSLTMYFASEPILRLFTSEPEIIKLGKTILLIDIVLEQGRAANICLLQSLQVATDNKFLVPVTIGSTWMIAVLGGYFLGVVLQFGLVGIWIAMTMDELIRAGLCAIRWQRGAWKKENILLEKTIA